MSMLHWCYGMLIILFAIQESVCGYVLGRSISLGGSSKKEVSSHCCIAYYNAWRSCADGCWVLVRHVIQHSSISRQHMVISVSPVQPGDGV